MVGNVATYITCKLISVILTNAAPPLVSPTSTSVVNAVIESEVTIGFMITRAVPPITSGEIQWTFSRREGGTEDITNSTDSQFIFSLDMLSLTIAQLSYSNEGTYTLIAINVAGRGSSSIEVDIQGKQHVNTRLV